MSCLYRSIAIGAVVGLLLGATACDEEQKPAEPPKAESLPTATATAQEPKRMPEVSLHLKGVNVGIDELLLTVPSFDVSFKALLAKYPVEQPDTVIFNVERKVPTPVATKIFYALVDAGAKQIEVRTKPRGTFPDKLIISSEKDVDDSIPGCTYIGMIVENFGAAFWRKQGGTAKRYTKGMAGPDLSALHEVMHKEAQSCNSKVFLFSAADEIEWGHAYDVATSVKAADPPYENIDKYVLLRDDPVPGKPLKIGSP